MLEIRDQFCFLYLSSSSSLSWPVAFIKLSFSSFQTSRSCLMVIGASEAASEMVTVGAGAAVAGQLA